MSFSPRLLKTVIKLTVVITTAAISSLLIFHALALEDRSDYTGLKQHESFPILVGGALLGGAAGGVIAAWLFLNIDFKSTENTIMNIDRTTERLEENFDKLDTNLRDKIVNKTNKLDNRIIDISIQKINELQKSINELRENPENPSSTA